MLEQSEFWVDATMVKREGEAAKKEGVAPSFRSALSASPSKRKAERRQTRRATAPHCCGSASLRDALACRRSTSGVFLGASERSRPASGHASWDAAATFSSLDGRYPPLPVPVQCAPHSRPGLPAADAQSRPGAACNSARGHRPRSRTAMCLRGRSFHVSENHGSVCN